MTRQGKDVAIRCPFHEGDDTPSLIISPASNLFHCFACEAAGSVIDGVMKTRGGFGDRLGDEDARGVVPLCLRDPAKRYGSGGRSRHGDGGQGHDYDRGQRAVLGGGPTDHPCPSDRLLRSPRSKERQCHRIFEHAGGLFKGHAMLFALAAALSGSDPAQNYTASPICVSPRVGRLFSCPCRR